jgi:hypothetical protein
MQCCVVCKKTIPINHDLCDEHRNILNSIFDAYNKDPEVRRRWDSVLELIRTKGPGLTDSGPGEDVFELIDEMKSESDK